MTFATWALVIATIALVFDSWSEGREQQKRWNSEDERSREQTELQLTPHASPGLLWMMDPYSKKYQGNGAVRVDGSLLFCVHALQGV